MSLVLSLLASFELVVFGYKEPMTNFSQILSHSKHQNLKELPLRLAMAKTTKNFCIDKELIEKLSAEPNQSGLINDLLTDYYNQQANQSSEIIKESIKNNKIQINIIEKHNKILQSQMKKIIKKNIQMKHSTKDLDNTKKLIQDKRVIERQRAREFELYIQENKISLTKLDFHDLMREYSEETRNPLIKFMKSHTGI